MWVFGGCSVSHHLIGGYLALSRIHPTKKTVNEPTVELLNSKCELKRNVYPNFYIWWSVTVCVCVIYLVSDGFSSFWSLTNPFSFGAETSEFSSCLRLVMLVHVLGGKTRPNKRLPRVDFRFRMMVWDSKMLGWYRYCRCSKHMSYRYKCMGNIWYISTYSSWRYCLRGLKRWFVASSEVTDGSLSWVVPFQGRISKEIPNKLKKKVADLPYPPWN